MLARLTLKLRHVALIAALSCPTSTRGQVAVNYDVEGFANMSGGVRRGTTSLGNLNVQLTLDMEHLAGWRGATIFVDGLGIHGGQPSDFAGDAQGVSSIEAPSAWKIEEAWIQQNLFANRFSALIGRYDLNSEFYHLYAADLFLNSSFGIGPEFSQSGREGPSVFPNTAIGARFELKPARGVVLRSAVLDGIPVERPSGRKIFAKGDGLLIVGEAAFLDRPRPQGSTRPRAHRLRLGRLAQLPPYDKKLAIGVWHYTETGGTGAYLIGDAIVRKNAGRQLRAFGQLGIGDGRANRFGRYAGGGINLSGMIPGRANDEVGVGVAAARNGSNYIEQQRRAGRRVDKSELTIELAYRAPLTSRLAVQPDIQYVISPNTDPRVPNALVGLIRIEYGF